MDFMNADEVSSTRVVPPGQQVISSVKVQNHKTKEHLDYSITVHRLTGNETHLRRLRLLFGASLQPSFTPETQDGSHRRRQRRDYRVLMPAELDRLHLEAVLLDAGQVLQVTSHPSRKDTDGPDSVLACVFLFDIGNRELPRISSALGSNDVRSTRPARSPGGPWPRLLRAMSSMLYRVPWCAIKATAVGFRHVDGENPALLDEEAREASGCRAWLSCGAAVVGAVSMMSLMAFWVQREVLHVTHIEQVLGGLAAIMALGRSAAQIIRHRRRSSGLRRFFPRILWVIPIFTIDAWVELLWEGYPGFWVMLLHCLREVAEAVALISFMQLLLSFLGGPLKLANLLLERFWNPVLSQSLVRPEGCPCGIMCP
eukprot:g28749.t1